jgi:hypothetical protein
MPDDRMLHRCQGFSSKLATLDHLAYRVWTQYLLSADDFGVCPDSPALIRGANLALAQETEDAIRCALDDIVDVGLVVRFEHQGQPYVCSLEWQDYQSIRWPRTTYYPAPSAEVLPKFSRSTSELFKKHSARNGAPRSTSGRASHRLTANGLRLTAKTDPEAPNPETLMEAWNAGTTLPIARCAKLTDGRRRKATARLKALPLDDWRLVIERIEQSAFCHGVSDTGWVASFDWLLQADVPTKVMEGKYDDRAAPVLVHGRREQTKEEFAADVLRVQAEREARRAQR